MAVLPGLPPPIPVAAPTDALLTLWIVGAVCVVAGCMMSLRTIVGHWHYWNHPKVSVKGYSTQCDRTTH